MVSKCIYCGKDIDIDIENSSSFEFDLDGDVIHTSCKDGLRNLHEEINKMSDEEFEIWLTGRKLKHE